MKSEWDQKMEDFSELEGFELICGDLRNPVICLEVSDVTFFHNTLRSNDVPLKVSFLKILPSFYANIAANAYITAHFH